MNAPMNLAGSPFGCLIGVVLFFSLNSYAAEVRKCNAPAFQAKEKVKALQSQFLMAYHEVLLENEASGGRLAYCLSRSGMTDSGVSFGVSQFDLRTNDAAWPNLLRVLTAAEVDPAVGKIPNATLVLLEKYLRTKRAPTAKQLASIKDRELEVGLDFLNKALASSPGRAVVDDLHIEHLREQEKFVESTIQRLGKSRTGAEALLRDSLSARLFLVDFSNLFGGIETKMLPFLSTGRVTLPGGTVSMLNDKLGFPDFLHFVLSTKQASGCEPYKRFEVLRRANTVVAVAKKYGEVLPLSTNDKAYLAGAFDTDLKASCVSQYGIGLPALNNLVSRAK